MLIQAHIRTGAGSIKRTSGSVCQLMHGLGPIDSEADLAVHSIWARAHINTHADIKM